MNATCLAPARPDPGLDASLSRVFSDVSLYKPVTMVLEPDLERYWFVAEQDGDVWRFDNDRGSQDQSRVLRLTSRVESGFELGLLGIALHPNFQDNGFLTHTFERSPGTKGRVSRFTWDGHG